VVWISLSLTVGGDDADAWSDALLESGALSVDVHDAAAGTALEKPQFGEPGEMLPGAWEQNVITALFDPGVDVRTVVHSIASAFGQHAPAVSTETIEEQDWVRLTQSQFEPIRITSRMWILPSWHQAIDADAINLVIDPGLAFGTGSHATTRLCLQWLEAHLHPGERVLDYGCGSGILAIAARRLGAGEVTGTDVDPQALEASRTNAAINHVDCRFVAPEALGAAGDEGANGNPDGDAMCDVLVANILTNPLRMLAPAFAALVRAEGRIVLSGILAEQAPTVIEAYSQWFNIGVWRIADGWAALAGTRR
jgi:ribosomal protein L11 methyltransferase